MTSNGSHPEPGPTPPDANARHHPEALADAAWRHLVNRHQLAAVLDQLCASPYDTAQLNVALAYLAQRPETGPAGPVPNPVPAGESQ